MTSSIITNRVKINIGSGQPAQTDYINLDKGTCIGVYYIPFLDAPPTHAVEMSVRDPQSNTIVEPVDYRDFLHKGGGYIQGMKQVNFPTNNNKFQVTTLVDNPAPNVTMAGELVFVIQRDTNCITS